MMTSGPASPPVCRLPGGLVEDDGAVHREAVLTRLSGREEELLADLAGAASPAELVTEILSRCVRRIGAVAPVTPAVARRLLVADRQFLLLRLREATFGARVEGTLGCPWPACQARIDVSFSTADVPVTPQEAPALRYRIELPPEAALTDADGDAHRAVTVRLPNGGDQEALAAVLAQNPAEALTRLFARCLVEPAGADAAARLSPQARLVLEQAMAAHAPHLDLEMDLVCPECARRFTAPFDLQDFFFGELRTSRDLLYRQVHYLAFHYHWSEQAILEMPREKRLAYIDILADEIEALNDAR